MEYSNAIARYLNFNQTLTDNLNKKMAAMFAKGKKKHRRLLEEEMESHLRRLFEEKRQLRWQLINGGTMDGSS